MKRNQIAGKTENTFGFIGKRLLGIHNQGPRRLGLLRQSVALAVAASQKSCLPTCEMPRVTEGILAGSSAREMEQNFRYLHDTSAMDFLPCLFHRCAFQGRWND